MTAAKQRVTDSELKTLEEWLLNVNSARPGPETREALLLVIDEVRFCRDFAKEELPDIERMLREASSRIQALYLRGGM